MKKVAVLAGGVALVCAIAASAKVATVAAPSTSKSAVVTVVTAAATPAVSAAQPVATAIVAPAASAVATATTLAATLAADPLPPLNLANMKLWNYAGTWHASEWADAQGPIPWKFNHVKQPAKADTLFTLDAAGAPELQAQGATPAYSKGLWEAEVTLPKLRDGLVVAPLWLYDSASKDEIDFELAGRKGLDVTMHAYVKGVDKPATVRLFAGQDMSGQRKRFGIKVDEASGWVEMYVDRQRVYSWNRSGASAFVSHPLKPIISLWAANPGNANFVSWVGKWAGITGNDSLVMTVHGYRYTPLS